MSIVRTCNGCGEAIPAEQAGALTCLRDRNPGIITPPSLAALDRTDWCKRCAAPILAALGESLTRARQARERRLVQQRARSLDIAANVLEAANELAVRRRAKVGNPDLTAPK